ncbi:hypothetical protein O6H91_09G038700 [Diphasiastrum complanatum]|uniref:Uncharacterized protein n=1 Tax=Diphasiastrum complanatum TaxID=34168 RepID=A0ACC2CN39_DIPCM|nr:hypothetical protein O6H91_09G038700 [Diphasiastrum complanatum]
MKTLRVGVAMAVFLTCVYILSLVYIGGPAPNLIISEEDKERLRLLQDSFQQCVKENGFGLLAEAPSYCTIRLRFPNDTQSKWRDPKTGELEPVIYEFNICESLSIWEQIRNSSTILTKEYIDGLPNGWEEYAWRRINKGILLNKCQNKTLCMEKLSLVLPNSPPFVPREFGRCAVVGNSGDLLVTKFGDEIDNYDAVIRGNGAPTQNYTQHVGKKSTFRLLNRGSAKALDKVAALDDTKSEVLIVKTTIHDIMSKMIKEVPIQNPVYLMLGTSLGSSAKGTGVKALEFALSVCETVDIYGFTVDPGYTEWSRYFSESRGGHTPLLGRAYYQMMECLGLITIHSPLRSSQNHRLKGVPKKSVIDDARKVSERICRKAAYGREDPLSSCILWSKVRMSSQKKIKLKGSALAHYLYVGGVTQYPVEHSSSNGMLCVRST